MKNNRRPLLAAMLTLLAGCASVSPRQDLDYECEGGRGFQLSIAAGGQSAVINLEGLRFNLQREVSEEAGERFGCGIITVWRNGDGAHVALEDKLRYTHCLVQR